MAPKNTDFFICISAIVIRPNAFYERSTRYLKFKGFNFRMGLVKAKPADSLAIY